MAGILYETDSFINQVVNKAGVATVKVFGGNPLVMGNPNATDSGLRDLTVYATGGNKVVIPFVNTKPLDADGFPLRSIDRRKFEYQIGQTIDFFIPEASKGTEFGVIGANITGGTSAVGKFLEPSNGSLLFTSSATQTSGIPSFEVIRTYTQEFPTGDFTSDPVTVYVVATRYNG